MFRSSTKGSTWAALLAGALMTATLGLASTGCTIRTQGPIKEVAYDFSDRDFYDRAYAASPKYLEADEVYGQQPLAQRTPAEPTSSVSSLSATAEALKLPAAVVAPSRTIDVADHVVDRATLRARAGGQANMPPLTKGVPLRKRSGD